MSVARQRHRLSAADVTRMIEAGVLTNARVELIDGELLAMNAQGAPHVMLTVWLRRLLESVYGAGHYVQDHSPISVTEYDRPEPDLALVRGTPSKTAAHLPTGSDLVLVVEVSFTTLREDRAKAEVYARGGVPNYWLVNADEQCIEVHTGPRPDGSWLTMKVYSPGEHIAWPERKDSIDAAQLLP